MGLFQNFLFLAYFIQQAHKGTSQFSYYYVKSNYCSASCDGSLERPFPDIITAFIDIDRLTINGGYQIKLKLQDEVTRVPDATHATIPFNSNSLLNLKVTTEGKNSRAKIEMGENSSLSFLIKGGFLGFENIDFMGSTSKTFISYDFAEASSKIKYRGFLILEPKSKINLELKSCRFSGLFIDTNSHIFLSLIYVNTYNLKELSSPMALLLENITIDNSHYPQGLMYSNGYYDSSLPQLKQITVTIMNLEVLNYCNKAFPHWKMGYYMEAYTRDYFDFLIILNHTKISISNLSIFNSSRIILANNNNLILIEKLLIVNPFDVQIVEKAPPEMIYLINLNILNLNGIILLNSTIYSFDDMVEPNKRDLPLFTEKMAPACLLKLEKNQALFFFTLNNVANISNLVIRNSSLLKKENFLFALFDLEYKNKMVLTNFTLELMTLDTESKFGILTVFEMTYGNELKLINGDITDFNIYGYSIVLFGNMMLGNVLQASNLLFLRTYFKTKSNDAQVKKFIETVNVNPSQVFVVNTATIMVGSAFLMVASNYFIGFGIFFNDTLCVFGCFINAFFMSSITLNTIQMKQPKSDMISSSLALAQKNVLSGKNIYIEDGRGNSGVIYGNQFNELLIEDSKFISNWGMGGFSLSFRKQLEVCGNIALSGENRITLKNSLISNGYADLTGGALHFKTKNLVQIELCIFLENESSSATSTGGAIYTVSLNTIIVNSSKFINNYGTFGGALYGVLQNKIFFDRCIFDRNQGEVAAVAYLNENNTLILTNSYFTSNQGFVSGGLIVISGINHVIQGNNLSFVSNQAPFKGNLIELSENNCIFLKEALVEYGNNGNGNFIFLNKGNLLIASGLTVRNIMRLEIFIFSNSSNQVDFLDSTIYSNEWVDSFFYSESKNQIKINNCLISNITVAETAKGLVSCLNETIVHLKNISLISFSVEGQMVLAVEANNKIFIESMIIKDIKVVDKGSSFSLYQSNYFEMKAAKISNFLGFSNDVFLFQIHNENVMNFQETSIFGYFSQEQVWNFTCIIQIQGDKNLLNITGSSAPSENPSDLKVESLTFLKIKGLGNRIMISNTTISLKNYLSFLNSERESDLIIENSNFKYCELYGDLIILYSLCAFKGRGLIFHQNTLRGGKGLILLGKNVVANLKKISSNTNTIFLRSLNAVFNISKSTFISKHKNLPNSSSALIICDQNSLSFFEFVEVYLRKNSEDSILLVFSSAITIRYSTFGFNKGSTGGVIRLTKESQLVLDSSIFYGNEALLGGVLNFDDVVSVSITGNYFFSNIAINRYNRTNFLGKGGCVYASIVAEKVFRNFEMRNNDFILGGAEIGGILYLHERNSADYFAKMNFRNTNRFKKTKVRYYGETAASHPEELKLVPGDDLNSEPKGKLQFPAPLSFSTPLSKCLFQVIPTDFYNQTALGENYFKPLSLNYSSDFSLDFSIQNSLLCFSALKPASSSSLSKITEASLKIKLNSSLFSNSTLLAVSKILEVELIIRKCTRGEYFNQKQLECLPCEFNFYSFESEFIEPYLCKSCISEAFFCYGGFNHSPKAGYWRTRTNSINFIKCPNTQACLGDPDLNGPSYHLTVQYENFNHAIPGGICAFEYEGILCSKCRKGYSKTGGVKCSPCYEGMSIFLMVLKIVLRVLLYYYTIYKAVMMCRKVRNNNMPTDLVYSNFLLKILILHFQFLKSFIGFPFLFPSLLKETFNIFSFSIASGADKVLNLECFIDFGGTPQSYVYSVINLIAPLVVVSSLTVFLREDEINNSSPEAQNSPENSPTRVGNFSSNVSMLFSTFSSVFTNKSRRNNSLYPNINFRYLPYYILISLMLSYDEVLSLLIHNFSFINVDNEESPEFRVVDDFEIEFYSHQHQTWIYSFALPATILIGVMLPIFIIYKIFKARRANELKSKTFLLRYGYFFFAYDENYLFYELVYILRKIFMFAMDAFFIKVFSLSQIYNPLTFSILICFFYSGLSVMVMMKKPYKNHLYPVLNHMENISLSAQALTAWVGCLLLSVNYLKNEEAKDLLYMAGFLAASLINLIMFSFWTLSYWRLTVASKFKTAMRKLTSLKKKNTQTKQPTQIFKKHETLSENEILDVDKEMDRHVYIPPHLSSRWSSKLTQKSPVKHPIYPFVIVDNSEINPSIGYSWIEYLWKRNDVYNEKEPAENFIKILSSKWETKALLKCSKFLELKKNRNPILKIGFSSRIGELSPKEIHKLLSKAYKVSYLLLESSAFLISLDYTYEQASQLINFKVKVQIDDFSQISLVHNPQIFLISESGELLSYQIDILMFDFIEICREAELTDEAFDQLSYQGIQYSSDSRVLNFKLSSEDLTCQIIKSRTIDGNAFASHVFFYRELKSKVNPNTFYLTLIKKSMLY